MDFLLDISVAEALLSNHYILVEIIMEWPPSGHLQPVWAVTWSPPLTQTVKPSGPFWRSLFSIPLSESPRTQCVLLLTSLTLFTTTSLSRHTISSLQNMHLFPDSFMGSCNLYSLSPNLAPCACAPWASVVGHNKLLSIFHREFINPCTSTGRSPSSKDATPFKASQ